MLEGLAVLAVERSPHLTNPAPVAGVVGAWAGLNTMAPESSLTTAANYGMMGAAAIAAGPSVQSKFGNRGRNILYGGVGGTLGLKMFGVI